MKLQVLDQWEDEVRRELPAATHEQHYALINTLPEFLEELGRTLIHGKPLVKGPQMIAREHVQQRWRTPDYTHEQIQSEYCILKQVIGDALEAGGSLTVEERDLIADFIADARVAAAHEFVLLERKKLEESEERLSFAANSADLGIFDWNPKSGSLNWSERQIRHFGYDPASFHGGIENLWSRIDPSDVARVREALDATLEHGKPYAVDHRVRWPDGSMHWIAARGRAFRDAHGEVNRFAGVSMDVTRQKSIEESFSLFFEFSATGNAVLDDEGRFLHMNRPFLNLVGHSKEELLKKSLFETIFLDSSEADEFTTHLRSRPEGAAWSFERLCLRKGGASFWASIHIASGPLALIEGARHTVTIIDVSETKRIQRALSEAISAREHLLAVVSHDLRNPLGSILMSATLMSRKAPEDTFGELVRKQTGMIQRAGKRMNVLIENLLSLAKIDSGHLNINPGWFDIRELIQEAIEGMRPWAREKSIQLRQTGAELELKVHADYQQILRVITNLMDNAIKFTPEGGWVELGADPDGHSPSDRLKQEQPAQVHIWVRDMGPGIAQDHLFRIFDRYWQVQDGSHRGTGLGLSIARGIVEAHGGRIWAESVFGEGTTFHFILPESKKS